MKTPLLLSIIRLRRSALEEPMKMSRSKSMTRSAARGWRPRPAGTKVTQGCGLVGGAFAQVVGQRLELPHGEQVHHVEVGGGERVGDEAQGDARAGRLPSSEAAMSCSRLAGRNR